MIDMSNLATVENDGPNNVSPMFAMIERAARDPAVDIDKLERLMLMKVNADALQARGAYDDAMAALQPELPVIAERGQADR